MDILVKEGDIMEQYIGLANIYDMMIDMDYDKWIAFLEEYFQKKGTSLSSKRVLELGCGTGNMTLRLREKRMDVTALDISGEMLSVADEKAQEKRYKIRFLNQDMRRVKIGKSFDMVCSFCDGFNYLIEDKDVLEGFKRAYEHLSEGGHFFFDISTQHKLMNIIGNNTFTLNEDELCYIWDNYLEDDILEMYITFFVKKGTLYERFEEKHVQRAHSNKKIKRLLTEAGFNNIEIYDDYSFEKASEESTRAVFIARK